MSLRRLVEPSRYGKLGDATKWYTNTSPKKEMVVYNNDAHLEKYLISPASFEWISLAFMSAVMKLDMDHHLAKARVELPTPELAAAAAGPRAAPCLSGRTRAPHMSRKARYCSSIFIIHSG
jgi:hypothetical protein